MKYYNYDIVFQEIPDEVTLAINLTGCPNHCQGCHSPHLWDDVGTELTDNETQTLLQRYGNSITCVCFMGGDADIDAVEHLASVVHSCSSLKVAWYSGRNQLPHQFNKFQYVKLGPYQPKQGGLKSRTTNQRFYRNCNGNPVDITSVFWQSAPSVQ